MSTLASVADSGNSAFRPCECSDRECPVHKGRPSCPRAGDTIVYRSDMEDRSGVLMCEGCAADALDSGVFHAATGLIRLEAGSDHGAPCCYVLVDEDTGEDILVQTDWDYPSVASAFGFVPCDCGETDGTVDCPHKTAGEMITAAAEWLDDHIGETVEDPGYFAERGV